MSVYPVMALLARLKTPRSRNTDRSIIARSIFSRTDLRMYMKPVRRCARRTFLPVRVSVLPPSVDIYRGPTRSLSRVEWIKNSFFARYSHHCSIPRAESRSSARRPHGRTNLEPVDPRREPAGQSVKAHGPQTAHAGDRRPGQQDGLHRLGLDGERRSVL